MWAHNIQFHMRSSPLDEITYCLMQLTIVNHEDCRSKYQIEIEMQKL